MTLRPGMVFKKEGERHKVVIVDHRHYYWVRDPSTVMDHGNDNLSSDLSDYGWVLDEENLVTSILTKYGLD